MVAMVIHEHAVAGSWHLAVPRPLLYLYQINVVEKGI